MTALPELLAASRTYATLYHRRDLPRAPRLKLAVLACMDARFDPIKVLGLRDGDANVIRNAGGRAADALRSLAVSTVLLGTREIVVIHHTDCGLHSLSNENIQQRFDTDLGPEAKEAAAAIDFLPFADLEQSVRDDVAMITTSRLLPDDLAVAGFIFDDETGQLRQVV
jgi:carbonic anhydrase